MIVTFLIEKMLFKMMWWKEGCRSEFLHTALKRGYCFLRGEAVVQSVKYSYESCISSKSIYLYHNLNGFTFYE